MAFSEGDLVRVFKADRVTVDYVGKVTKVINEPVVRVTVRVKGTDTLSSEFVPQTLVEGVQPTTANLPADWQQQIADLKSQSEAIALLKQWINR